MKWYDPKVESIGYYIFLASFTANGPRGKTQHKSVLLIIRKPAVFVKLRSLKRITQTDNGRQSQRLGPDQITTGHPFVLGTEPWGPNTRTFKQVHADW